MHGLMPAFETALLTSAGEKYKKTTPSPKAVPPCKDLTTNRTYIWKYSCSDPRVACVLRTWYSDTFASRVYEHGDYVLPLLPLCKKHTVFHLLFCRDCKCSMKIISTVCYRSRRTSQCVLLFMLQLLARLGRDKGCPFTMVKLNLTKQFAQDNQGSKWRIAIVAPYFTWMPSGGHFQYFLWFL